MSLWALSYFRSFFFPSTPLSLVSTDVLNDLILRSCPRDPRYLIGAPPRITYTPHADALTYSGISPFLLRRSDCEVLFSWVPRTPSLTHGVHILENGCGWLLGGSFFPQFTRLIRSRMHKDPEMVEKMKERRRKLGLPETYASQDLKHRLFPISGTRTSIKEIALIEKLISISLIQLHEECGSGRWGKVKNFLIIWNQREKVLDIGLASFLISHC